MERLMRRFASAGTRHGPDALCPAARAGAGPGSCQAADGRVRGGLRRPIARRAAAGAGRRPGAVQRAVDHARPAPGQARGGGRSPARCWRTSGPIGPSSSRSSRSWVRCRRPECVPVVLRLACQSADNALRTAALTALTGYDDPAIAAAVLAGLCQHVRRRAGCRPDLARVPPRVGRSIPGGDRGPDDRFPHSPPRGRREAASSRTTPESMPSSTRLFGPIKPATSAELHARIDRLATVIRAGSGVPKPGKQLFDQHCARCHALFGSAGQGWSRPHNLPPRRRRDHAPATSSTRALRSARDTPLASSP